MAKSAGNTRTFGTANMLWSTLLYILLLVSSLVVEIRTYVVVPQRVTSIIGRRLQSHERSTSSSQSSFVLQASDSDGMSFDDDDEEEDDDDIELDDSALGDWRKFRASLIDGGLKTSTDEAGDTGKLKKRQPVAVQNEKLLEEQSAKLAEEYRSGVWAHTIGEPEVGGLLCRLPIEAEIYYGDEGHWKDKIKLMITMDDSSAIEDDPDSIDKESDSSNEARVNQWFTLAERMVSRELQEINNSGKIKNGILNPNDLEENSRIILDRYMDYKQTWQEVCLVLSHHPESGCSESLVINRPITKNINRQLVEILLRGNKGDDDDDGQKQKFGYDFEYGFEDKMVQAFGKEAAVYLGGPNQQKEPASLIHGIPNLDGAKEIAPGTGIYQGGLESAVDGILNGLYKPLDFRFFVGRQVYDPKTHPEKGTLLQKVQQSSYKPIACARSVALKQCLGLPKPLWHEVLELCGGEMKSLSSIELKKRIDLQQ